MRRATSSLNFCLGLLFAATWAQAQAPQPRPAISFAPDGVAVQGVTAGGRVVWYGLEGTVEDYSAVIVRHADVVTAAADGTAAFSLGRPSATSALWIAVDLASGAYDVAVPEGFTLRRLPAPPTGLSRGTGADLDHLTDPRAYIEVLVVRPGAGAWTFRGGDGGVDDDDGAPDGLLHLPLDRLAPLAGSPATDGKIGEQDLWFVLDPNRFEISIQKGGIAQ